MNRRLSSISANKDIFDEAAPTYQEALDRAGYHHKLEFDENVEDRTKKRKRKRNITYFNPPFNLDVKTKVGREFLKIVDSSFPVGNPLHGKLTRQNLKISYSTTSNMRSQVSRHNSRLLSGRDVGAGAGDDEQLDPCVCTQFVCPLNGRCEVRNCVYQATVSSDDGRTETYVGVTKHFKQRYGGHRSDFAHPENRLKTTLSKYIWKLKDENKNFNITWSIIDRGSLYNINNRRCSACVREKFHIIFDNPTLNRCSEIFNTCRHRLLELLKKQK